MEIVMLGAADSDLGTVPLRAHLKTPLDLLESIVTDNGGIGMLMLGPSGRTLGTL